MKNIHVIPTDKPSRIIKSQDNDFILLNTDAPNWLEINLKTTNQNIYITNNEEIKEGSIVKIPCGVGRVKELHWKYGNDFPSYIVEDIFTYKLRFLQKEGELQTNSFRYEDVKKIILTTDRKLIKDGVQAIDDEFLEWFVKNPSCEEVEVKSLKTIPALQLTGNNHCMYQLIIPKEEPCTCTDECLGYLTKTCKRIEEEPKQETLEEVAERYANMHQDVSEELGTYLVKAVFQDGAKWQKEQCKKDLDAHLDVAEDLWLQVVKQNKKLYSEEELLQILESHKDNLEFDKDRFEHDRWFEQFKKK